MSENDPVDTPARVQARKHLERSGLLYQKNMLQDSEIAIRDAIAADPSFAAAYSNLGAVLISQGRLVEAENACRLAITADPNYGLAHSQLGSLLKEQSRFLEAEACFRKAITLLPKATTNYYALAEVLKRLNRPDEARNLLTIYSMQAKLSNVFQALEKLEKGFNFPDAEQRILWVDVYNLRQELTQLERILNNEPLVEEKNNDGDYDLRTVACPHCDHYQKVHDSTEYVRNGTLEIYKGDLEEWEALDEWAFFVVTCDSCGQRFKMQSDNITFDDLAELEDNEEDE